MEIIDKILIDTEYNKIETEKTQIYLHHTAGGHRGDLGIGYWAKDKLGKVATAYMIGGISTRDGNSDYDGKIYRAFEDKYWAYHLGLKLTQNLSLNKKSVGIEICNYGPLKEIEGKFINYVHSVVPAEMVYKLPKAFKSFTHYHKYSKAQLISLKKLILDIADRYSIPVKKVWNSDSFQLKEDALKGVPGIWTHVNVRRDKYDCHPQPELIDMLNSL